MSELIKKLELAQKAHEETRNGYDFGEYETVKEGLQAAYFEGQIDLLNDVLKIVDVRSCVSNRLTDRFGIDIFLASIQGAGNRYKCPNSPHPKCKVCKRTMHKELDGKYHCPIGYIQDTAKQKVEKT
jgi:hypothetical protein